MPWQSQGGGSIQALLLLQRRIAQPQAFIVVFGTELFYLCVDMKSLVHITSAALLLLSLAGYAAGKTQEPVVIDYFFESNCKECKLIKESLLPQIAERFGGFYRMNLYDISSVTNIARLIAYQDKLKVSKSEPVMMVLDHSHTLNGYKEIKDGLASKLDECIASHQESDWVMPPPIETDAAGRIARERLRNFTLLIILSNGFIDGLNPCAISTLVFLISLMAVAKVRGSSVLALGISYTAATFAVYTAIGLGLLGTIRCLNAFTAAAIAIKYLVTPVLAVFAYLSFRDAYRFHVTGLPSEISLQLPGGIKSLAHRIMKRELSHGNLIAGGLIAGAVVTALESVCTGQAYLPTIVYIIRSGAETSEAWTYLLVYNAMFIIPLVIAFIITYYGTKTERLLDWSRKNVVVSKVLLGLLFILMAVLIAVT